MSAEQRIFELGISLPMGSAPAGNYVSAVQSGNLVFISGRAPLSIDGRAPKGQLGREFSTHDGYDLARSACVDLLAVLKHQLGSLDKVEYGEPSLWTKCHFLSTPNKALRSSSG